jgi:hypothetical protein
MAQRIPAMATVMVVNSLSARQALPFADILTSHLLQVSILYCYKLPYKNLSFPIANSLLKQVKRQALNDSDSFNSTHVKEAKQQPQAYELEDERRK